MSTSTTAAPETSTAAQPLVKAIPAAIGEAFAGGIYAGIMRGVDGAADYHMVLLPGAAEDVSWEAAGEWAKAEAGDLPSRREQRLLFINLKDQFEEGWYWSNEPAGPSTAWSQDFYDGYQGLLNRSYEGRARAVRRLEI